MNTRIVVDTSVLISALIGPTGPSREVLRQCLQGYYKPLMSNALFWEYEAVANRNRILSRCPLTPAEIRELLNAVYRVSEWTSIYYLWRPNLQDENDNFLIELAIAGNAGWIVTNNVKDLTGAELFFPHLKIVRPDDLLGRNEHGNPNHSPTG